MKIKEIALGIAEELKESIIEDANRKWTKRHDLLNRVSDIKCCNFSYSCPFMRKVISVVMIDMTIGRRKFLTKKRDID